MTQLSQKYTEIIQKEAYFLYNTAGVTGETEYSPYVNPVLAQRVPENKICNLAKNRKWQSGINVTPWSGGVGTNSYVYNPQNGIVYLLIEKGPNNRNDEWSRYLSTELPTHETGYSRYSDYHTWFAFYKVPENKIDFLDVNNLPVPLDFYPESSYNTFEEKYEYLCTDGVTAFGCCCLYYRDYDKDEITGEVYNVGDVTNQSIFSQCYECQQIAELLEKDFIFLAGQTPGDVSASAIEENPLCPATKEIKTLINELDSSALSSGSYLFFQRKNINSFENNLGIASITLDLTGVEADTFKMDVENPMITFIDPTGSGAEAVLKTYKKIIDGVVYHIPYGIDLLSRGKDYTFPDITIQGIDNTHSAYPIYYRILITTFTEDFLSDVTKIIVPSKISYETSITTQDLIDNFRAPTVKSVSLMLKPRTKDLNPTNSVPNDNSIVSLVDVALVKKVGTSFTGAPSGEEPVAVPWEGTTPVAYSNTSNNNYPIFVGSLKTPPNGEGLEYVQNGVTLVLENGWELGLTDSYSAIAVGDIVKLPDAATTTLITENDSLVDYEVLQITRANLLKTTGEIVSTVDLDSTINIANSSASTIRERTTRITINTGN